ncbi:Uncharacterised protein [Mycobacteroides abscessus subsp. abscessus]|nr:hypothetical protein [Mycobacteroides abscessus]SKN50619.1 Uncharacterised protein [Mycobacteroides abscessus subsp. abscessus]
MSPNDLPPEVWTVIRRVVAEAPPMTEEQRANIVALFRTGERTAS